MMEIRTLGLALFVQEAGGMGRVYTFGLMRVEHSE